MLWRWTFLSEEKKGIWKKTGGTCVETIIEMTRTSGMMTVPRKVIREG